MNVVQAHQFSHTLYVLLLFLLTALPSFSQGKIEKYDSLFTVTKGGKDFSGQVLVADKGNIIYQKNYGFSDINSKIPINSNSVFNIASLTKQFTAIGVVILQENKLLSYEDKITKFFPDLKSFANISLRNMLNNTSGIPNLSTSGEANDKGIIDNLFEKGTVPSNDKLIKEIASNDIKPNFEAGTRYEYSNTNYVLLASIIEKVSGKTYSEFLKSKIFVPLKMNHSFVSNSTPYKLKYLAGGYMKDSLGMRVKPEQLRGFEPLKRTSGFVGGMGVYSTTEDLYKWIKNFKSLISEESYRQVILPPVFASGKKYDRYGFGFELGYEKDFSEIVFHSGRWPGYSSYLEYSPVNGKTIILLQNNYNENAGFLLEAMKNVLYNIQPHHFLKVDPTDLIRLSGKYKMGNGSTRTIHIKDDKLMVAMNEQVSLELKPISKTKFVVDGFNPEVQYEFIIKNGEVEKYINTQPENGIRYEATKIQ